MDRDRLERRALRGDPVAKSKVSAERVLENERRWEEEHGVKLRAMFDAAARDKESLRSLVREMNVASGGAWDFYVQRVAAEFLSGVPDPFVILRWTNEFRSERDPGGQPGMGHGRDVNPHVAFSKLRLFSRLIGAGPERAKFIDTLRPGPLVLAYDREPLRTKDWTWILRHAGEIDFMQVEDAGGAPERAAERYFAGDANWRDADPEALVIVYARPDLKWARFQMLWPTWFSLWELFWKRSAFRGVPVEWFSPGIRRPAGHGSSDAVPDEHR